MPLFQGQKGLNYDETPSWYIPLSQTLGYAQLMEKQYAEAEKSFRKAQQSLQRNGRTLFGLNFVWRGKRDHKNVIVASYGICSFDPFKNAMDHLPQSDVWYKSWILPRHARTVYCISPDDPLYLFTP